MRGILYGNTWVISVIFDTNISFGSRHHIMRYGQDVMNSGVAIRF